MYFRGHSSQPACCPESLSSAASIRPVTQVPDLLLGLQHELGELNGCVGKQFLALADSLRSLSRDARQIARLSREATGLATAGKSGQALGMLQEILRQAERVQALGDTSREKLHAILTHLEQARAPLARLGKLPFFLSSIGILSRIEGSRIRSTAKRLGRGHAL